MIIERIRLIQKTIENAHKAGIPVGICGELGSDEGIVPKLIQMGIDELSMSPAKILPLRERILLQE